MANFLQNNHDRLPRIHARGLSMRYFDGLVQDCSISNANAREILQSWTKPSILYDLCSILSTVVHHEISLHCWPYCKESQLCNIWNLPFQRANTMGCNSFANALKWHMFYSKSSHFSTYNWSWILIELHGFYLAKITNEKHSPPGWYQLIPSHKPHMPCIWRATSLRIATIKSDHLPIQINSTNSHVPLFETHN